MQFCESPTTTDRMCMRCSANHHQQTRDVVDISHAAYLNWRTLIEQYTQAKQALLVNSSSHSQPSFLGCLNFLLCSMCSFSFQTLPKALNCYPPCSTGIPYLILIFTPAIITLLSLRNSRKFVQEVPSTSSESVKKTKQGCLSVVEGNVTALSLMENWLEWDRRSLAFPSLYNGGAALLNEWLSLNRHHDHCMRWETIEVYGSMKCQLSPLPSRKNPNKRSLFGPSRSGFITSSIIWTEAALSIHIPSCLALSVQSDPLCFLIVKVTCK